MGEFRAGLWITGITLYFFVFFLIVFTSINTGNFYDVDTSDVNYHDPGFQNAGNDPLLQGSKCTGSIPWSCVQTRAASNVSCTNITGCQWDSSNQLCDDKFYIFGSALVNGEGSCEGDTDYQKSHHNDSGFCTLLGCTWTDYTSSSETNTNLASNFDWSATKATIGVMSGFNADIGIPSAFQFIFSFLFFWIPTFMLIWAIYMALPWLH